MATTEKEDARLLRLYELTIQEHHYYSRTHQDRIAFFSGILSALLTATGAGFLQASEWYHFAFLCVGPILICAISEIAIRGTSRMYRRLLETITVRAKIEQELGLTRPEPGAASTPDSYWQLEPLIPQRPLDDRRESESSDDFIKTRRPKGYHLWITRLFRLFQGLSVIMLVGLLCLVICKSLGALYQWLL